MKKMRKILLLLGCVMVLNGLTVAASDWFVRPAGGNYGTEDGSSYQDAWDGLLNVVWGAGGVGPGDTLYVCGLHVYDMTGLGKGISGQADIRPVSGTSESARVTIRGDCPGDQGIVWGAYKPTYYGNWVDETGYYSLDVLGTHGYWFFEDVTADSWVILDRKTNVQDVKNNAGSFYWDSANTKLYVHTSDNGDPTGRILLNRHGYDWKLSGLSWITFQNLKFYNQRRFIELSSSASHITWEGCTMSYGGALFLPDGSHYIKVIDCELSWMSNGIYTVSGGNNAPSNYIFSGNYIHDIGNYPGGYNGDAHAIGIQGGHNGLIEKNYILRAGNAILLYAFSMQELKDTIVRYNYVKDTHTSGGTSNGKGISTQTSNHGLSDKTGNEFYGNILHSINSYGFYLQFEDEQKVYNNVMYDCSVGIGTTRNVIIIEFDNGTEEFSKYDSISNGLGATATVDGLEQSGSSPNITGRLALDNLVGTWLDNDNIQIGGDTKALVDGDQYNLGAHITARNNIILDSRHKHVDFVASTMARYIENFDYNLYYPDTGTKFGRGHNDYDFAGWQAIIKAGSTFDPNSIVADPLFVDPENGGFNLLADSPAFTIGFEPIDMSGVYPRTDPDPDPDPEPDPDPDPPIESEDTLPDKTELKCFNNIFNPTKGNKVIIKAALREQAELKLTVYNSKGKKIIILAEESKPSGFHTYTWDGKDDSGNTVGSGIYIVHMKAGQYRDTKKIAVIK